MRVLSLLLLSFQLTKTVASNVGEMKLTTVRGKMQQRAENMRYIMYLYYISIYRVEWMSAAGMRRSTRNNISIAFHSYYMRTPRNESNKIYVEDTRDLVEYPADPLRWAHENGTYFQGDMKVSYQQVKNAFGVEVANSAAARGE
eukprot:scaffold686351_cov149-Attheya_sp.AAC.1